MIHFFYFSPEVHVNNNMGLCLTWLATSLEEKRRWFGLGLELGLVWCYSQGKFRVRVGFVLGL